MAVVRVFDDAIRVQRMEGSPALTFSSIPSGGGTGAETVTFFQGTQSSSRKVTSSSDSGFYVTSVSEVIDYLTSPHGSVPKVVLFKIFVSDYQDLLPLGDGFGGAPATGPVDGGLMIRFRDSTANSHGTFLVHDDGTLPAYQGGSLGAAYPVTRSWLIAPINPTPVSFLYTRDGIESVRTVSPSGRYRPFAAQSAGQPGFSAVDEYGITAAFATGAAKAVNLFIDSIDVSDALFLVGGDGADADAVFQDFIDYDEGDIDIRLGHVITQNGILYTAGKLIVGRTAVAGSPSDVPVTTVFSDTGSVIVVPGAIVQEGWHEFEFDISGDDTVITLTDGVIKGRGATPKVRWFHSGGVTVSDGDVEFGGTEEFVELRESGIFDLGDFVQIVRAAYDFYGTENSAKDTAYASAYAYDEGTGLFSPVTEGRHHFYDEVSWGQGREGDKSIGNWRTWGSGGDNNASSGRANQYNFIRRIDGRPNFTVTETGSPVGTFAANGFIFDNLREFSFSLNSTLNSCKFIAPWRIYQNGATFNGCSFNEGWNLRGQGLLISDDPTEIVDCDFTARTYQDRFDDPGGQSPDPRLMALTVEGYAIEITAPGTYTLDGNTFTGFDPDKETLFNVATDIVTAGSPLTHVNSINVPGHGYTDGDAVIYTKNGGSAVITDSLGSPEVPVILDDGLVVYIQVVDSDHFRLHSSPGNVARANRTPTIQIHIPVQNPTTLPSPEEIHGLYPAGAAILNNSGGLVTLNVVNASAPSIANINGSTTAVNTNVAVTITNLEVGSEVRVYPGSANSPLDLTEIDGIESVASPTEFTFTAPAGQLVDIVIFHTDFVLPPDNRIRNFEVPTTATSFPVTQIVDRNFSNP